MTSVAAGNSPKKALKPVKVTPQMLKSAVRSANLGSADQLPPPSQLMNSDGAHVSVIRLTLDDIENYEYNPRHKLNPNYLAIKGSIKARGLEQMISVTKRPGSKKYTLAKGGNTRRQILTELWRETEERKFYEMDFLLVPYVSDSELLASHISENLHRGDMSFWDKAAGIVRLKRFLEDEQNASFTHTECVEQFKAKGLPDISRSLHALYEFADQRLQELNESKHELTMMAVRDLIQPGFVSLKKLADLNPNLETLSWFIEEVWPKSLQEFNSNLQPENEGYSEEKNEPPNWANLIPFVETKLATAIGVTPQAIQSMLSVLKANPKATWDEIQPAEEPTVVTQAATATDPTSNVPQPFAAKLNRLPGTYVPTSSTNESDESGSDPDNDDNEGDEEPDDRPPQRIVDAFKENQQAQRRLQQDLKAGGGITSPLLIPKENVQQPETIQAPASLVAHSPKTSKIIQLVTELASLSPTLVGSIITNEKLPIGWMIELPCSVIDGTPLPPLAKQLFHFLSRASFQLHVVNHDGAQLENTNYWAFVNHPDVNWDLIQPVDGFEFLMAWLIDPENHAVGYLAQQILQLIKQQIADDPAGFTKLEYALDFRDLKLASQAEIQNQESILFDEFIKAGAHHDLLHKLFPRHDLTGVSSPPRPRYEPKVEVVHAIWSAWEKYSKSVPSERDRMILTFREINEAHPSITMTAIHGVLTTE